MAMPQSYTPITDPDRSPLGGCFRRLCCGWDDGGGYLLQERERGGGGLHEEDSWLVGHLKKLKQLSEVVAGPKWKNVVRKIGKLCKCKCKCKCRKETAAQFQYSPESYALNFAGDDEHANLSHSFSTRFALIGDHQRKAGL